MNPIYYIDRQSGQIKQEKVYREKALELVYGQGLMNRFLKLTFLPLITRFPLFSKFYGFLQKLPRSVKKIEPFIKAYEINTLEFAEPVSHFRSFNDFFIRHLKPEARPIDSTSNSAVIPADGRYYFFENINHCDGFLVKGKKFHLKELLGSVELAKEYEGGSMVMARLCPSDYHRFHFPIDSIPSETSLINGYLYSVNPMAVKHNIHIFSQNKRTLSCLKSSLFDDVLYMEIGATCVGSIQQTYEPNQKQQKGQEKGYFEFGGSSLIILFKPNRIRFNQDLLDATHKGMEILCLMGQQMGAAINSINA
ncbi:MAG: phosphatidylserine decarboxylase [Parachlamydiaceae bacterium]|nr:phosphatidylserine decarboxylase [Parachlamydiaceae bacterium]